MRSGPLRLLWPLLLALGCGELDPAIGPAQTAPSDICEAGDSDPTRDVAWPAVRQIFVGFCGCHTTPGGLGQTVSGLNLATFDSALAGGLRSQELAIVPGDPCGSIVVQKTGRVPPFGAQMPLDGAGLPADSRQLIIDWIAEGAPR